MIVINLKNYKSGQKVLDIIKEIEIYYNKAIVAVPLIMIREAVKSTTLEIFAQHVDFQEQGRSTGHIIPENVSEAGARGTILNHSEYKLKLSEIKKTLKRCNEAGLKTVVCVSSLKEAKQVKSLAPFAIAFEDKKLISTGKSITEYKANEIKKFVELMKDSEVIPLCGAGISSGNDVAHALSIGCKGVLVSSAIADNPKPEIFLKEISGLSK